MRDKTLQQMVNMIPLKNICSLYVTVLNLDIKEGKSFGIKKLTYSYFRLQLQ